MSAAQGVPGTGTPGAAASPPDLAAIAALRAKLWRNGYRPIAVLSASDPDKAHAGKKPIHRNWGDRARQNPPEAARTGALAHAANTGILTDALRLVDVDVDDLRRADAIEELAIRHLGGAPTRRRDNTNRFAMLYRAIEGEPPKRRLVGTTGDDPMHPDAVEILGRGQQFVAYGQHVSGGVIYWTGPEPLDMATVDLPAVTEEQLTAFLDAVAEVIRAPQPEPHTGNGKSHDGSSDARAPIQLLRSAVAEIPNADLHWDDWSRVGMAIWTATLGSDDGFALFAEWSAQSVKHHATTCVARWREFATSPPKRIGAGTLFHLAAENGWTRPAAEPPDDWEAAHPPAAATDGRSSHRATAPPAGSADPQPAAAALLRIVTVAELLTMQIPARAYALAPVLPLPGLAMLYGPRGIGKTYATLSMAYAKACGGSALRWKAPEPRRVLYVDGEMPAGALQERLAKIVHGAGLSPPADDALKFLAADLLPEGLPSLRHDATRAALDAVIESVDVVILDNLSALVGGLRENEADDWDEMQQWLLSIRRRGKSALLVHHAGKGGNQRGTSRREDVLDTVIALRRPSDYRPDQGARFEVHLEKARGIIGTDAEPFSATLIEAPGGGLTWATSSLPDEQRTRAEDMLRDGVPIRDVADEVGMSKSAVHRLKKNMDEKKNTDTAGRDGHGE